MYTNLCSMNVQSDFSTNNVIFCFRIVLKKAEKNGRRRGSVVKGERFRETVRVAHQCRAQWVERMVCNNVNKQARS